MEEIGAVSLDIVAITVGEALITLDHVADLITSTMYVADVVNYHLMMMDILKKDTADNANDLCIGIEGRIVLQLAVLTPIVVIV